MNSSGKNVFNIDKGLDGSSGTQLILGISAKGNLRLGRGGSFQSMLLGCGGWLRLPPRLGSTPLPPPRVLTLPSPRPRRCEVPPRGRTLPGLTGVFTSLSSVPLFSLTPLCCSEKFSSDSGEEEFAAFGSRDAVCGSGVLLLQGNPCKADELWEVNTVEMVSSFPSSDSSKQRNPLLLAQNKSR